MGIREIKKNLKDIGFEKETIQSIIAGIKTIDKGYQKLVFEVFTHSLSAMSSYYHQEPRRDWCGVTDFEIIQELTRFQDPNFEFMREEEAKTIANMLQHLDFGSYYQLHQYFHFVFKEREALDGEPVRRTMFYIEAE